MDVRHFSISAHGLYRGGSYVGTHGVARDITEHKFHERKRGIMQRVREAVWNMVNAEDIQQVLEAIRTGLDTMGVSYQHCAVNVVDTTEPPMLNTYQFLWLIRNQQTRGVDDYCVGRLCLARSRHLAPWPYCQSRRPARPRHGQRTDPPHRTVWTGAIRHRRTVFLRYAHHPLGGG